MAIAQSRLTAQGQISVPAEIRRRLGLAPGSVIEWDEQAGNVVVRRAAATSLEDIRKFLFPGGPPSPAVTVEKMDDGIRQYMTRKHARR
jgi:AbrB family looped-hinge helix DNA binding protein